MLHVAIERSMQYGFDGELRQHAKKLIKIRFSFNALSQFSQKGIEFLSVIYLFSFIA